MKRRTCNRDGSDQTKPEVDVMLTKKFLSQSDGWDHMNGWGGGWMWLWGAAMMTLLVILIVWLSRAAGAGSSPVAGPARGDPNDRAREILGERFAKGELTTEEYRERTSELQ
ncbi:MAG: putative membrane protein [Candidatus Azotimanducaceae bacterium]|jgi:putative membrane protein